MNTDANTPIISPAATALRQTHERMSREELVNEAGAMAAAFELQQEALNRANEKIGLLMTILGRAGESCTLMHRNLGLFHAQIVAASELRRLGKKRAAAELVEQLAALKLPQLDPAITDF